MLPKAPEATVGSARPAPSRPAADSSSSSTPTSVVRRPRASRPKSKTGCGTCKKRHKKCDEARPFCNTCLSKGYKCDGYADSPTPPRQLPEQRSSNKLAIISARATQTPLVALIRTPSRSPDSQSLELKYLQDFATLTVPQLTGAFNEDFFKTKVLRAAQHTPAIRHALVAVGGLHAEAEQDASALKLSLSDSDSNRSAFILDQYGKALNAVVQLAAEQGRDAADVVLSVCLLCVLFESLRGNYTAAQIHTQSGVKLLLEVLASRRKGEPEPRAGGVSVDSLTPLLMRLDLQAADPSDYSAWNRNPSARQLFEPEPVATAFESVEQSKQVLLEYEYKFLIELRGQMMSNGPDPMAWVSDEFEKLMNMRDRYGRFLGSWSAAHKAMVRRMRRPIDTITKRALAYLSINSIMVSIIVALFPMEDEMKFDEYHDSFKEMLRSAASVISEAPIAPTAFAFSFDLGLSEPLHWLAMRCRDPMLRRRANEMLALCPIREGIWNSQLASVTSKHAIEIEESLSPGPVHSAADVPREARIQYVRPTYMEKLGAFDIKLINRFGLFREIQVDYEGIIKGGALSTL